MKKNFEDMSARELFDLAREREKAEWERTREERRGKIQALRADRKSLQKSHAKALKQLQQVHAAELASIDSQIAELTGQRVASRGKGLRSSGQTATGAVMEYIGKAGQASSKAIKAALDEQGAPTAHISQTLAYLVRQGQVERVGRGMYRKVA